VPHISYTLVGGHFCIGGILVLVCFGRGVYELDMSNMNYSCHVCTAHMSYTPLGGHICAGGVWVCLGGGVWVCLGGGVCCGISTCEVDLVCVCDEVWGY